MSQHQEKASPAHPDWRNAQSYRPLRRCDRAGWAWEFLRRNADYRATWRDAKHAVAAHTTSPHVTVLTMPTDPEALAEWGIFFCRFP